MDLGPFLNKRCRIERPVSTQDTYGAVVTEWVTLAVVWCEVQDRAPSRDEQLNQTATVSGVRARVRMRYRSDVDTSVRLVIMRPEQTVWGVVGGPAEIGNRDCIELMCEKVST